MMDLAGKKEYRSITDSPAKNDRAYPWERKKV
jgi:hypothetical protein